MDVSRQHNQQVRRERLYRAMVRQLRVAVVNMANPDRQGVIDWKTCNNLRTSRALADAICHVSHRWVIFLGALCIDDQGRRYLKGREIAPQGIYRSDALSGVMEAHHRQLIDTCNPQHLIGGAWIAIPCEVSLTEEQAFRIFEACGGWTQQEVAA